MSFYDYLLDKGYVQKVSNYYNRNVTLYTDWLDTNKLAITNTNYTDLMDYVGYLQEQGKSNIMVNKHLKSIELYYTYLKIPNIAYNVRVKSGKTDAKLYLAHKELDHIYTTYQTTNTSYYKYSDKLLLSLIIYQGLELQDLLLLNQIDINLEKGTVYIPSGKYLKNSRTLDLEAHQIIPLHTYITNHKEPGEKLFLPQASSKPRLAKQLGKLHKTLQIQTKELEISYQSLQQLRQSRIVYWIKQYGLREAQYLSGHKGITSIERYQSQDIEDLTKQINKFHPLG